MSGIGISASSCESPWRSGSLAFSFRGSHAQVGMLERSHRGGGTIPRLEKVLKVLSVTKSVGLFPSRYVYQELPRGHLNSVDPWDKRVERTRSS